MAPAERACILNKSDRSLEIWKQHEKAITYMVKGIKEERCKHYNGAQENRQPPIHSQPDKKHKKKNHQLQHHFGTFANEYSHYLLATPKDKRYFPV